MSEHTFTPGPWWIDASRYGTIYIEANAVIDKRLLQEICAVGTTESGRGQQEANARLIAAAPTQHEEMLRYLPIIERAEADHELWTRLTNGTGIATANGYRAAIAKATGETP